MMKIDVQNGVANIYTPYNAEFVKSIKAIGGAKWNASQKCWSIPESSVEIARQIMTDVYGYSDVSENETITLKVTFNEDAVETCSDVVLYGKVLAHAYSRDGGARVGEDVAFSSGMPTSGGSRNRWASIVEKGSVAVLTNVNKNVYEKTESPYDITVEIVGENRVDRNKLLGEKERLLKRLAEIDKLLAE